MKKIRVLDGIRGLAVLLVFFDHGYLGFGPRLGQAAVYLFFILSAFLMFLPFFKHRKVSLQEYFKRRIFRVVPLYWVMIFIYVIERFITNTIGYMTFEKILYNMFFLQGLSGTNPPFDFRLITQSWTLVIEMQFYLCIPVIAYFLMKNSRGIYKKLVFLYSIGFLSRFILYFLTDLNYGYPFFIIYLDLFTVGILLSYLCANDKLKNVYKHINLPLKILIVAFFIITGALTNLKFGQDFVMFIIIPLFCTFSFFFFIMALEGAKNNSFLSKILNNKILVFIGEIGYSFYLIHFIVLKYVGHSNVIELMLSLVVTIMLSIISKYLIEDFFVNVAKNNIGRKNETN